MTAFKLLRRPKQLAYHDLLTTSSTTYFDFDCDLSHKLDTAQE
jgi:hypothetical protein